MNGDDVSTETGAVPSEGAGAMSGAQAPPAALLQPLPEGFRLPAGAAHEPLPPEVIPHLLPPEEAAPPPEPPLSMLPAIFLGWIAPAKTARRTQQLSLGSAYLAHWIGVILTYLILAFAVGMVGAATSDYRSFSDGASDLIADPLEAVLRDPRVLLGFGAGVVGMELVYLLTGLVLAPWGAVDESFSSMWCNGLRQAWLHTADAIPGILIVSLLMIPLINAQNAYHQREGHDWATFQDTVQYPDPPTLPDNATPTEIAAFQQAQIDYQQAFSEYHASYQERYWAHLRARWSRKPFFVKYTGTFIAGMVILASLHVMWLWLRAIGARRQLPRIPRQPVCEACGYVLAGIPWEARCPECGEPAAESIRGIDQRGTPWERRREIGWLRAYLRSFWWFCLDARSLGRSMVTTSRRTAHRAFLFAHLPLVPVAAVAGMMMVASIKASNSRFFFFDPDHTTAQSLVIGMSLLSLALLVVAGSADLVADFRWFGTRRNLSGVAMQAAAYGAPFLVLVTLASAGAVVGMVYGWDTLRSFATRISIDAEFLSGLAWFAVTGGGLLIYLARVWQITGHACHANR